MNCPFCEEMATGLLPAEYDSGIGSRVVTDTTHFVVVVDISPLAPGHVLIIPRAHILSFGATKQEHREELTSLVRKVKKAITEFYAPPVIMEHGSSPSSDGGACISHAHLQVFPGNIDIREALSRFRVVRISSFWELAKWASEGKPYLYYENQAGDMLVADDIEKIEKQFIRIEISKRIGLLDPNWDWRRHSNRKDLIKTIETLKKFSGW
jgi:histidine triad (HIT) family protein